MRLIILHTSADKQVAINPKYITSIIPKEADTAQVNLGPGQYDEQWHVLESFDDVVRKVRLGR